MGVAEKLKEPIGHATRGFADKMATERMKAGGQPVYTNQPGSPMPPNPGPDVSDVQKETTEPTLQDAFEPSTESPAPAGTPPLTPDQDLVNTFAEQNTSKKYTGAPSPG